MPNIVMSLWSAPGGFTETSMLFWRLAHALACKHYGGVHLITDSVGAETLREFNWLSVDTSLDELPLELANIWSLGKIKAYRIAAERFGSFVHIDGDVFLWQPLPEWLISAPVLAQHPEKVEDFYDLSGVGIFPWLPPGADLRPDPAPNMGITGGIDADFWMRFADNCLAWLLDERNRTTWLPYNSWWGAVLAEQWYLAAVCLNENVPITYLFDGVPLDEQAQEVGYTHLLGAKRDPDLASRVRDRLSRDPYDLSPRTS